MRFRRSMWFLTGFWLLVACLGSCEQSLGTPPEATAPPACTGPDYVPKALPPGVPRSLYAESQTLFVAPPSNGDVTELPVQRDVPAGTILPNRIARLAGHVFGRDGSPLPCVRVTVQGHREYGSTLTRKDGRFDMAVNDGSYVVQYELAGYLPVQRPTDAEPRRYAMLPDVILTKQGAAAQTVVMGSETVQVVRGAMDSDAAGARQPILMFMPGTRARLKLRDGGSQEMSSLAVRTVEYTVGSSGPSAMPGALPPTSGYTYAVELLADEVAANANATTVEFDKDVPVYLDGFLAIPVGSVVPSGYYDAGMARWIPAPNGVVVKLLGVMAGKAMLDVTGTGKQASAESLAKLKISDAELLQLGQLGYPTGKVLWRVPVSHFTPWDFNFPAGPPSGAVEPSFNLFPPTAAEDLIKGICAEHPTSESVRISKLDDFAVVDCVRQVIRYHAPIDGTNGRLSLVYVNNRVPGFTEGATLLTQLSNQLDVLPSILKEIRLTVQVSGRTIVANLMKTPPYPKGWLYPFQWDGKDGFGNFVAGPVKARATISYLYEPEYYTSKDDWDKAFGKFPPPIAIKRIPTGGRSLLALSRIYSNIDLHARQAEQPLLLGGFSVSAFHSYHSDVGRMYLGDGRILAGEDLKIYKAFTIERYAGTGQPGNADGQQENAQLNGPVALAWSNNSNPSYSKLMVADAGNCVIRRVTGSEVMRFAGLPIDNCKTLNPTNEQERLTTAKLPSISALAFGPDQNLYAAMSTQGVIQVVNLSASGMLPDYVYTVAGTGTDTGGTGSAAGVGIGEVQGIAIGTRLDPPGLTMYASGTRGDKPVIQRIDIAAPQPPRPGNTWAATVPDSPKAVVQTGAAGSRYGAVVLADHGTFHVVFAVDTARSEVLRITISKDAAPIVAVIAGTGTPGPGADGPDASRVSLNRPEGLALSPDGSVLYIADTGNRVLRRIKDPEGTGPRAIETIAGVLGSTGSGCNQTAAVANNVMLGEPVGVVATSTAIYVSDRKNHSICAIRPLDGMDPNKSDDLIVPHSDTDPVLDPVTFRQQVDPVTGERLVTPVTRFYYFTRAFNPQGREYPGIHKQTKTVPGHGATDPNKAMLEFLFNVDAVTQKLSSVEDRLSGKTVVIAAPTPAALQINASGAITDATLSGGFLNSIKGKASGREWSLGYQVAAGKNTGLLTNISGPAGVTHDLKYQDGGRLQLATRRDATSSATVNLMSGHK